eukprot:5919221-Alexandrium_andersonii.AAC.1
MSASLVGSEMCIRDRTTTTTTTTATKTTTTTATTTAAAAAATRLNPAPVSYTHLTLPTICSV